jgi:hypothetical protein
VSSSPSAILKAKLDAEKKERERLEEAKRRDARLKIENEAREMADHFQATQKEWVVNDRRALHEGFIDFLVMKKVMERAFIGAGAEERKKLDESILEVLWKKLDELKEKKVIE